VSCQAGSGNIVPANSGTSTTQSRIILTSITDLRGIGGLIKINSELRFRAVSGVCSWVTLCALFRQLTAANVIFDRTEKQVYYFTGNVLYIATVAFNSSNGSSARAGTPY
jgi:hypothetical protein